MQQIPHAPRDEPVRVEVVLLDVEQRVVTLEIAGAISGDPVPQNQILRARRRANGIGLDKAKPIDGALQCERFEERLIDRVPPRGDQGEMGFHQIVMR